MRLYYRISDNSYKKPKLIGATKEVCLINFCSAFEDIVFAHATGGEPLIKIIADRCERKTMKMLTDTGLPVTITDYGNAGSLRHALELAVTECADEELAYFCEDDYLHLPHAPKYLNEGIKRADYVTLYDHPDKYTRYYNGGEHSKVIKTTSTHWRYTCSTCMTFGAKVKTIKEDLEVWKKYTDGTHPHDHHIFTELGKRNRRLIVPIPGAACHTDMDFSGRMSQILMEDWAIEMMIGRLAEHLKDKEALIDNKEYALLKESALNGKTGWQKLVSLDSLIKNLEKPNPLT